MLTIPSVQYQLFKTLIHLLPPAQSLNCYLLKEENMMHKREGSLHPNVACFKHVLVPAVSDEYWCSFALAWQSLCVDALC